MDKKLLEQSERFVNISKGNISNLLLGDLLKTAGYLVIPHGYEITHPKMCYDSYQDSLDSLIQKYNLSGKEELEKIRSSPDLKIKDNKKNIETLVESKLADKRTERGKPIGFQTARDVSINRYALGNYQNFWPQTLMVFSFVNTLEYLCVPVKDIRPEMIIEEHTDYHNYNIESVAKPLTFYFQNVPDEMIKPSIRLIKNIANTFEDYLFLLEEIKKQK